MIYLEVNGRLGNQMFRYAFARWLLEQGQKETEELVLDFSSVFREQKREQMDGWEDSLRHFHVLPYSYYEKEGRILVNETTFSEKSVLGLIKAGDVFAGDRPLKRLAVRKPFLPWLNRRGIYYLPVASDYPFRYVPGRKLVCGAFECERYPREIREILLREFEPVHPVREENKTLLDRIRERASVCVTVRRGNYLQYPLLDICSAVFFERAARQICELVASPLFVVFSDDIAWCREHLHLPGDVLYESGEDPVWEKLRLMSACRHFIIANSTFSWWAQFLGQAEDRMVIAPERWLNSDFQPDLYQEGWILMNPDPGGLPETEGKNLHQTEVHGDKPE